MAIASGLALLSAGEDTGPVVDSADRGYRTGPHGRFSFGYVTEYRGSLSSVGRQSRCEDGRSPPAASGRGAELNCQISPRFISAIPGPPEQARIHRRRPDSVHTLVCDSVFSRQAFAVRATAQAPHEQSRSVVCCPPCQPCPRRATVTHQDELKLFLSYKSYCKRQLESQIFSFTLPLATAARWL